MHLTVIILIFAQVLCGRQGQKEILRLTDIYSKDIARSGYDIFWKVDGNSWTTVVSTYPVPKNVITKVTFNLLAGGAFMFGCGTKTPGLMGSQFVGQMPNTVSYFTENGQKYKGGDQVDYSTPALAGDNVTMIIDLRQNFDSISYEKNRLSLGVSFSGISEWGDIYIMFSIHWAGHRVKITNYQVIG